MNFDSFDFSAIKHHLDAQKEVRKGRDKEDKKAEKTKKEELTIFYGGAILDGFREKVGQFMIEPPTLFKGRGEHPKMGLMKGRIMPEAVVINIAQDSPVPRCSVPGMIAQSLAPPPLLPHLRVVMNVKQGTRGVRSFTNKVRRGWQATRTTPCGCSISTSFSQRRVG